MKSDWIGPPISAIGCRIRARIAALPLCLPAKWGISIVPYSALPFGIGRCGRLRYAHAGAWRALVQQCVRSQDDSTLLRRYPHCTLTKPWCVPIRYPTVNQVEHRFSDLAFRNNSVRPAWAGPPSAAHDKRVRRCRRQPQVGQASGIPVRARATLYFNCKSFNILAANTKQIIRSTIRRPRPSITLLGP